MSLTDRKKFEKMELWALKRILNLPRTTPTAAVRFVTGIIFTELRIDQKQLIYLQRILKRDHDHWTYHMLNTLDLMSIGWAHQIRQKLNEYGLEENWEMIRQMPDLTWKHLVKQAVENRNKQKLLDECKNI